MSAEKVKAMHPMVKRVFLSIAADGRVHFRLAGVLTLAPLFCTKEQWAAWGEILPLGKDRKMQVVGELLGWKVTASSVGSAP